LLCVMVLAAGCQTSLYVAHICRDGRVRANTVGTIGGVGANTCRVCPDSTINLLNIYQGSVAPVAISPLVPALCPILVISTYFNCRPGLHIPSPQRVCWPMPKRKL
jgi:hypothetical protein